MNRRVAGVILLLVGSVALGLVAGSVNWTLFRKAIPPTMASELNQLTARGVAYTYGLFTAVVLFFWGLIVALVSPAFRRKDNA
jgi:hypothetical protein